jgi:predicted ABC-type ATPase
MRGGPARRLRMFAGPNGSGKSSLVDIFAKERSTNGVFWLHDYLNADDVELALAGDGFNLSEVGVEVSFTELCQSLRDGGRLQSDHPFFDSARLVDSVLSTPAGNGYVAAAIVDFLREELIRRARSFSFETVMSHPSKVEFFERARAEGYKTYLYFICTNRVELNIARVDIRAQKRGHAVPEDKIRERYTRCLDLAREALRHSYRAYFFDNSGREPVWLAEFDPHGTCDLKVDADQLPDWFRNSVLPAEFDMQRPGQ